VPVQARADASGAFYMMALVLAIDHRDRTAIARARGLRLCHPRTTRTRPESRASRPIDTLQLVALASPARLRGCCGRIQALFVSYVTANGTFNITVPLTVVLMSACSTWHSLLGRAGDRRHRDHDPALRDAVRRPARGQGGGRRGARRGDPA
jgi:hypothetical protein